MYNLQQYDIDVNVSLVVGREEDSGTFHSGSRAFISPALMFRAIHNCRSAHRTSSHHGWSQHEGVEGRVAGEGQQGGMAGSCLGEEWPDGEKESITGNVMHIIGEHTSILRSHRFSVP